MHIYLEATAYWSAVAALVAMGIFIVFIELFHWIGRVQITATTPGWHGMIPSFLIVGGILAAFLSAMATVFAVWI